MPGAAEKGLADFATTGPPQFTVHDPAVAGEKPILLFLPGIEGSGYSVHRQVPGLAEDFDFRWLSVPPEDRTSFDNLAALVAEYVEAEHAATNRSVYLAGESFGGVLALTVACNASTPPAGLAGLVLINPATAVTRSWPSNLPGLLDGIASLPDGVSDATYFALATPIFTAISGDPIQLGARRGDELLPPPLRLPTQLARLLAATPQLGELPQALPLPTLAFRLKMLLEAAEAADALKLAAFKLPVQLVASTDDRVLPSVEEARRLSRKLPNARVTRLEASGHVPLMEARVDLAKILRDEQLLQRTVLGKPKDYVVDFVPPSEEAYANASRSLSAIRKITSPVFLSTTADGRRVAGLGALPPLGSAIAPPPAPPEATSSNESSPVVSSPPASSPASSPASAQAQGERPPPVLFIGNHQLYGFLDLPLLVEEVQKQTGTLIRGLAHPVAFSANSGGAPPVAPPTAANGAPTGDGTSSSSTSSPTPPPPPPPQASSRGGGGFVNFETFGAVPVNPRALFKLMSRGESALLYPGGVREAFKSLKKGEQYKLFWPDGEETSDFARVAARFNATIVPVAAIGAEEGFEMLLDADELLDLPVLGQRVAEGAKNTPVGRPGERFVSPVSVPKLPGRYYFLMGSPIETSAVDPSDKEACAALYGGVKAELEASIRYLLDKREADPYEALLPRVAVEASWNFTKQVPSFEL